MNTFSQLAPELLENIFCHLSQRDLTHVVRVCRSFALSGRLLLYRHIELHSDSPNIKYTLALLRGDSTIGVQVFSALIATYPPKRVDGTVETSGRKDGPWIDPTFAVHWTRLKTLEMRGFPFSDKRLDARNFSVTVRDCCPQLEKFSYVPGYGTLPKNFELRGLKEVAWHSGIATIDIPVQLTMDASRLTLTTICFTGTVFHSHRKPYDHFLHLDFPSLRCLSLGSLQNSVSEIWTNTTVTKFILKHPTIEHLSLGKRRPTHLLFFQFVETELKSDSLPALKSFEGFPENVALLARRGVKSFFHIKELSISCQDEEPDNHLQASLDDMYEAVIGPGTHPRKFMDVVTLRCELRVAFSHTRISLDAISETLLRSVDQILHLCPVVEKLYARLPPMSSAHVRRFFYKDDLKKVFRMCDQLEVLSLPRLSMFVHMPPSEDSELEYFRPVSCTCTSLRKVIARRPDYSQLKDFVFLLERDTDGALRYVKVQESWNEDM